MPTTPAKKTSTPRKSAAKKPAPEAMVEMDAPETDAGDTAGSGPRALRLKELVERVTATTGGKKKGVKEIVEATLAQLGHALEQGEGLNLPAFGRVRVAKGAVDGSAMTLKLRRGAPDGAKKPVKEPLAEPVDQV